MIERVIRTIWLVVQTGAFVFIMQATRSPRWRPQLPVALLDLWIYNPLVADDMQKSQGPTLWWVYGEADYIQVIPNSGWARQQ